MAVFAEELAALLKAYAAGAPSPLPEPAIQYVDYAQWQREWLAGPALDETLGYWKKQLGGRLPILELPTDRPRPPGPDLQRRPAVVRAVEAGDRGARRALPGGVRNAVHGAARRLQAAALEILRAARPRRRRDHGEPDRTGARAVDRLLHQHVGAAHGSLGRADVPTARRTRQDGRARRAVAPGCAVREAGRSAAAGTRSEPVGALPGVLHPAQLAARRGVEGGSQTPRRSPVRTCRRRDRHLGIPSPARYRRPTADRNGHREIRPDPASDRHGRRARGVSRIQHRPVRARDRHADARLLREPGAGGDRRAGRTTGTRRRAAGGGTDAARVAATTPRGTIRATAACTS